jgi:tight adherence protein B
MSSQELIGLLLGGSVGLGIVLVVAGLRGHTVFTRGTRARRSGMDSETRRRLALAVGAGCVAAVITRWPVAAIGTAVLIAAWPKIFGGGAAGQNEVERVEALAVWTESLRDTVAGNISLEQAIPATLDAAPPLMIRPLEQLVAMMRARVPLPEALTRFADDLDDASADLVAAALLLNAHLRGPGLEAALTELAGHARSELELRQRVEAGRKPLRRGSWIIVGVVLTFVAGLAVFARQFVEPYETLTGQFFLALAIGFFAGSFAWARKLSAYVKPARFLIGPAELERIQLTGVGR